ncbi:hypothetical protein [uncultured Kordia sp.]|uniref:hypothetical protein n=1 Tax=uncultured Kordia sp. TaxID=507699 RepID=UPI00262C8BC3|nr:hypothetical protein [uncultured Kordia sp.]
MKKQTLIIVLLLIGLQTILGQTTEQQRRADAYYQNQQSREQKSKSWNWLFNSSNTKSNYSKNNLVKWEYKDGGWYTGQINSSEYVSGFGTTKYADNNSYYSGQFFDGRKNGIGAYFWASGSKFFGMYKNDSITGLGIYIWSDNSIYNGYWKNHKREGFGINEWINGNHDDKTLIKYVGEHKNNIRHGYGIKYYKNGTYKSGIWIDDVLSKELSKLEVLEALGF